MSLILVPPRPKVSTDGPCTPLAQDEHAIVEVVHASPWFGRDRSLVVSIDDCRVGEVNRKAPGRFLVTPGRHKIAARMDRTKSQTVSVHLAADDRVTLLCEIDSGAARLLSLAVVCLLSMLMVCGLTTAVLWAVPALEKTLILVVQGAVITCLGVAGILELLLIGRMMPWNEPGLFYRLRRCKTSDASQQM